MDEFWKCMKVPRAYSVSASEQGVSEAQTLITELLLQESKLNGYQIVEMLPHIITRYPDGPIYAQVERMATVTKALG